MGFARKFAAVSALALAFVGGGVAIGTLSFDAGSVGQGQGIAVKPAPAINVARAATRLGEAVRFQTVSNQNAADNKVEEWQKLQSWLQTTYPAAHAAMERETVDGATLIYRWPGSAPQEKPIIMMAHQDVVPVTPGTEKDWKHPPFAGVIADDAVWGRGTVDDKGSLVALFEALDALAAAGFKPRRTIYLVSGHNEEVLGSGARVAAATLAQRKVRALFTIDEGGVTLLDAPLIAGKAIFIGVAEKGYGTLRLTARAPGGHSSMPPAETGVVNLSKAIVAINEKPFPIELKGPAADMLAVLADSKGGMSRIAVANSWLFGPLLKQQVAATPSSAAAFHTTIAPTMLEGSPKENVLPQSATALINYRIAPWNKSADVIARARSAIGKLPVTVAWEGTPREPSPVSSSSSPGWNLIAAAARRTAPDAVLSPYLVVGGTDSRNFASISDDVYRYMPAQFSTKDTAMIHGTNEHMSLPNLERMIRFYAELIATAAG